MNRSLKWIGSALLIGSFSASSIAATVTGAGATFPYPLYAKWAEQYKGESGDSVNYQSIGSGGGIKQIQSKTVDFGASDMPLKPEELQKSGLVQFPMVMGGVVPIINVPGVQGSSLKLTGTVLANIYLGQIKTWNDPAIQSLNPSLKLPAQKIWVVRRSDGSGTTFLFTDYLGKVSPTWASKVGANTAVNWPAETKSIGGKGNEGVANYVKRMKGAIGYVEYAYAKQNQMPYAQLQNKSGQFVLPSATSFKAAAQGVDWSAKNEFYNILTDTSSQGAWPITGATFILMQKQAVSADQSKAALSFFDWAYKKGDAAALALDYIPMPSATKTAVKTSWKRISDASNKPVYK